MSASLTRNISRQWTGATRQWSDTASKWRDNKGAGFEREYWSTLEREVPQFIESLRGLTATIRESQQKIPG